MKSVAHYATNTEKAEVFTKQQYGARLGFGRSPAFLMVDCVNSFKDPALFGSAEIVAAMGNIQSVLNLARQGCLPIFHTRIVFKEDGSNIGLWRIKNPMTTTLTETNPHSQVVPELRPIEGEVVIRKQFASAFFGTDLANQLQIIGADTLIVTGCSTSGCVQATVVDAMGYGFRPIVVRECVGDRHAGSHEMALLNMDMKYADVVSLSDAMRALKVFVSTGVESHRTRTE